MNLREGEHGTRTNEWQPAHGNRGDQSGRLTLDGMPGTLRWLAVEMCVPGAYALYATFLGGSRLNWLDTGGVLIGLLVMVAAAAYTLRRSGRLRFAYGIALLWVVGMELFWVGRRGPVAESAYVAPFLAAAVLYRLIRLYQSASLVEENRSAFLVDGVLSCVALVFLAAGGGLRTTVGGWLLVTMAVRAYLLWAVQRLEVGNAGGFRTAGWVAGLVAAVLFLGPLVLRYGLQGVGYLFALAAVPFLYVIGRVWPSLHFHRSGLNMRQMPVLEPAQREQQGTVHGFDTGAVLHLALYVVLVLLLVLAFVRFRRRRRPAAAAAAVHAVQTRRTWIRNQASLRFVATDHPVRQRYQAFLRRWSAAGSELSPNETPREYEVRLRRSPTTQDRGGLTSEDVALRERYEAVRYGEQVVAESGDPK
ncbi:MAG: DUF4129 domain-containing protein [Alicyclobacillus sp.]|nr:DUF4129 domain-containing protein [Alicyclobacillus sp.]